MSVCAFTSFLFVVSFVMRGSSGQQNNAIPRCLVAIPQAVRSLTDGSTRFCVTDVDLSRAHARASRKVPPPPLSSIGREVFSPLEPDIAGSIGDHFQAVTEELLREMVGLSPGLASLLFPVIDLTQTNLSSLCPRQYRRGTPAMYPGGMMYRRVDGYNTQSPISPQFFGASGHVIRRDLPAAYADSLSSPRVSVVGGRPLPPARTVSNLIHSRANRHDQSLNMMFVAFGQFLDHDITSTGNFAQGKNNGYVSTSIDCCSQPNSHHTCMPLEVASNDPFYSQFRKTCLHFLRVLPGVNYNCALGQRNQFNGATPVIDASAVYGSVSSSEHRLRDHFVGTGRMLTNHASFSFHGSNLNHVLKPLIPPRQLDDTGCIRSPPSNSPCFDAGDSRASVQPVLTTMHTIFVRAHNDIADELAVMNPLWARDRVYEETRRTVGAILQHIVLNEYLPSLLPANVLDKYKLRPQPLFRTGHDPRLDPQVSQSFVTAAFRFAHTLLPDELIISSNTHVQIGSFPLRSLLNRPEELYKPGRVDSFLLGALNQPADASDESITDEVRQFLFQEPGRAFGMDLAARNIQRGREHGVPGYAAYRRLCGLRPVYSWSDMALYFPNSTVDAFRSIYSHVADVDLWSAGIAENKVPGSILGPTFACLIGEQFSRLMRGDKFWYEYSGFPSSFTAAQLSEIKKMTFARMLCDHSDNIRTIQKQAFLLPDFVKNPRVSCCSGIIPGMSLNPWRDTKPPATWNRWD